jgi:ADP-ribose pyrophosphatase YjhB (NUDIX family)
MNMDSSYRWLDWAREIQALSQTGFHYAENDFQRQRNTRLSEIAAEIIQQHSNLGVTEIKQTFILQSGYATPRVDVRGAVFQEGKILLVRERSDNGWTMPGGWADVGDSPSESVEREVWEESGFKVKARNVIGVYDANRLHPLDIFHAYKIVFLCNIVSGSARTSNETSQVAFFEPDALPAVLSGERTKFRHISDAFHAYASPDTTVIFD